MVLAGANARHRTEEAATVRRARAAEEPIIAEDRNITEAEDERPKRGGQCFMRYPVPVGIP